MGDLKFDSVRDTVEAFRNGEFIIVLDSTDRENEGDLIIAASDLTTEKMAFMVRHTSGLVCTPLSPSLITKYTLPQMVPNNQEPHTTAFTISLDSRDPSITTGISAYDRALTIQKLADPSSTASDFRSPGHVFPLAAVEGGVTKRRGHTEAAIEFCRLSGKTGAAAICELVREADGGMMRRDDCLEFGRRVGVRVCTIEGLVEFLVEESK